jgi:hypothetical protein
MIAMANRATHCTGLGLHAYELDLKNPLNGKEYKFNAPMPPEFKKMFFKSDQDKKLEREETGWPL